MWWGGRWHSDISFLIWVREWQTISLLLLQMYTHRLWKLTKRICVEEFTLCRLTNLICIDCELTDWHTTMYGLCGCSNWYIWQYIRYWPAFHWKIAIDKGYERNFISTNRKWIWCTDIWHTHLDSRRHCWVWRQPADHGFDWWTVIMLPSVTSCCKYE